MLRSPSLIAPCSLPVARDSVTQNAPSPATFTDSVSETVASTDTDTATADFVGVLSEVGSAVETQTGVAIFVGVRAEVGAAADTETATAGFVSGRAETGTATDTDTATADFLGARSEAGAIVDGDTAIADFAASVPELGSAIESSLGSAVFGAGFTELPVLSGSESGGLVYDVAVDELGALADDSDGTIGIPGLGGSSGVWFGGFNAFDGPRRRTYTVEHYERVTIRDVQSAAAAVDATLSDLLALSEAISAGIGHPAPAGDHLALTDAAASEGIFGGSPTESLDVAAAAAGFVDFAGNLVEAVATYDTQSCYVVRAFTPPAPWSPDQPAPDDEEALLAYLMTV